MVRLCSANLCHERFHNTATSKGMCSAFNKHTLPEVKRSFGMDDLVIARFGSANMVTLPAKLSELDTVKLILDTHKSEMTSPSPGSFTLGISSAHNILVSPSILLESGYDTKISVSPIVLTASEDIAAFDKTLRGCRMSSEQGSASAFHSYHQGNCIYECLTDQVFQNKSCMPWDLPRTEASSEAPLCNGTVAAEFKELLSTLNATRHCPHCTENCQDEFYTVSLDSRTTDAEACCLDKEHFRSVVSEEEELVFRMEHSVAAGYLQGSTLPTKFCLHKFVHDLVVLEVRVDTLKILQLHREKSATIMDQLGFVGKNEDRLAFQGGNSIDWSLHRRNSIPVYWRLHVCGL